MSPRSSTVHHFEVALQRVEPTVWREIQVPSDYSFWDLHVAIQDAMGWLDYHLHEFEIASPTTGELERIGIPDDAFDDEQPALPSWGLQISDYFSSEYPRATYTYDFGDDWLHTVTLRGVVERVPRMKYPRCVAGKRACPPEDCGGESGYEGFLDAIQNPQHEEHDSMLEWVGGSFDPEAFDAKSVHFDDPGERWRIAFREG